MGHCLTFRSFLGNGIVMRKGAVAGTIVSNITLDSSRAPVHIPRRFISASIDTSLLMGGYWWEGSDSSRRGLGTRRVMPIDLGDPSLIQMASHLDLASLRIGGTEADRLVYRVKKKHRKKPLKGAPEEAYILDRSRWKEVEAFCRTIGAQLFMTLNAGPDQRREDYSWKGKNARALIRYSRKRSLRKEGLRGPIWELGNEVNAYRFFYGPGKGISPGHYVEDLVELKRILAREGGGITAGPALVIWPVVGEVLPFLRRFLKQLSGSEDALDILTWHFYPQQSFRCPVATRRANLRRLLKPRNLDALGRQARRINRLRDRYIPEAQVWLGETGHAQCGGEPGLSDRFVSILWWLDTLGQMALAGQGQVIRQSLIGGDYGLINYKTGKPNPDYWATLLWNRLMGERAYFLRTRGSRRLRLYLHSHPERPGLVTLLAINLDRKRPGRLFLSDDFSGPVEGWSLSSPSPLSEDVMLNGRTLALGKEFSLPDLSGQVVQGSGGRVELVIPPLSVSFFTVPTTGDGFGVFPDTLEV